MAPSTRPPTRPARGAAPFLAWLFALLGTFLSLLPTPVALVAAVGLTSADQHGLRLTLFVVSTGVLLACCGLPRWARAGSVRLANDLLGTGLPAPADGAARSVGWWNRLRTAVWLPVHAAVGWLVLTVTGLLVMAAAVLLAVWLNLSGGDERIQLFQLSVEVPNGWRGAWTVPVAAVGLLLALAVCVGARFLLRLLAPAFLGHGPGEEMVALEERMRLLAQRNRLAQELHDSIGHTLTASTIQAAVASETLESDPASARRALSSIEQSSRRAMDDLDHALGVLRADGRAPTAPPPCLDDLPALVDGVRRTGVEVRAELDSDWARVPTTVSREAYRVVQEGLTNALRHARGAGPLQLRVSVVGDWLEAVLTNPIPGGPHSTRRSALRAHRGQGGAGGGRGLAGVEERVLLLRGEVSSGPVPGDAPGGADGADAAEGTGAARATGAPGSAGDARGAEPGVGSPHGTDRDAGDAPGGAHWRLAVRIPLRSAP